MATKPSSMNVRFVRPEDQDAIERVQRAAQNGAVTVIHNPDVARFMALRKKALAIDTSLNGVEYDFVSI